MFISSPRPLAKHVPNVLTTLPTPSPMFDTLLPFSSENDDKVFNHGILASNEEKSPYLLSHRAFNHSKIISDFSKSPMMIFGGDIPILDVPIAPDYEASRARGRGPYANMKTEWASNPYLNINRIFERDYEASNVGCTQENQGHKGDPILEPSNYKVRRFEMMKYSFDDDEEYITIKESEYLNHSKDNLDAYRELLCLINEGWVVTIPKDK
ncbi:hypothetical protein Tco_0020077 [Tanacetum coccineum]